MAYKFNPHTGALDYYKDFTADEGHDLTLHQNLGLVAEPITYTIAPSGPGDTGGSYTDPYIFGTNGEQVLYVGTNNGNTFVQIDDIANGTYKIFRNDSENSTFLRFTNAVTSIAQFAITQWDDQSGLQLECATGAFVEFEFFTEKAIGGDRKNVRLIDITSNGKENISWSGNYDVANGFTQRSTLNASQMSNLHAPGSDNQDLSAYIQSAIEKTWQQLKDMKDGSTLVPEQYYKITDFRTYHKVYNGVNWASSTDYNTGTTDPIIVQAQAANSLFPFAYSTTYPQDSMLYELVDTSEMGGDRGRIYWRKDNTKLIEAAYDWRDVKWRRWEDAVGSGVYTKITDPGNGEAYRDRYTWQNSQDPNATKLATIVGDITQSFNNLWEGYAENFYLGNNSYDNTFIGNCTNTVMRGRAQNNIFRARLRQSTFGILCTGNDMYEIENCQIGDRFIDNTFSANYFTDNVIGNNFNNNSCVAGTEAFVYNTIGAYTTDNTFDLSDDTFTLNIIDGFCIGNTMASGSSNIIGGNFLYNTFGYSFSFNNIGASCTSNTMGIGFTGNTIGYGCSSNTFQDSTYYNKISATFQSNTFSGLCQYNEFGTNFLTNSFDTDVIGCIFPVDFQNQTIANALSYYVTYGPSHKIGIDVIEPEVKLEINDADSDGEEDTGIVTIHADKNGVATANDADLLKLNFDPTDNAGGNGNLLSGWRFGSKVINIASSGQLTLLGSGRVKKEVVVPVSRLTLGSSAPTATTRNSGASGGVKIPVLSFSKVTQQDTYGEIHMPTDVDGTVDVDIHLMWIPGAAWTSGNYKWVFEYLVKGETDNITTGTPTSINVDVTPANATSMREDVFSASINADAEQVIHFHLYRDVANDNGDDTGEIRFLEVEYTSDKLGEPV